jgi:hypothetical protein
MALKVQSSLIKSELKRFDQEEEEIEENVGKPIRSKMNKKTMFMRNK